MTVFTGACWRNTPSPGSPQHSGFREDVSDADRGNATFDEIWWSDDGSCFVTRHHMARGGLRVWDARTGIWIAEVQAHASEGLLWIDGARRRLVGRASHPTAHVDRSRLVVFDLDGAGEVASIPDDADHPSVPLGLVDGGASVVLSRPGAIEVWQLEPPLLLRRVDSPVPSDSYAMNAAPIPFVYHDEWTWELSWSGRWLALAHADQESRKLTRASLVDLREMRVETLRLPSPAARSDLMGFTFSIEEDQLAIGTSSGIALLDMPTRVWGPFLTVSDARNLFLGAMRFSAGGSRLIALGDQLHTTVFDVATGAVVGRHAPPFGRYEGIYRVSRDGSRIVIYHFQPDVLEVLDGADARSIGWICPYFCNRAHNPVPVHYGVSPDGRTVAASHRFGAGLFETDTDRVIAPLRDPTLDPLKKP